MTSEPTKDYIIKITEIVNLIDDISKYKVEESKGSEKMSELINLISFDEKLFYLCEFAMEKILGEKFSYGKIIVLSINNQLKNKKIDAQVKLLSDLNVPDNLKKGLDKITADDGIILMMNRRY